MEKLFVVILTMKNDIHCYLSEIGHNNFYYPTKRKAILKIDSKLEILPWVSSDKALFAAKVKNKDILFLTITDKTINIDNNSYSIVWISKQQLPLSSAG